MKKNRYAILFVLIFFAITAEAQINYQQRYLDGKSLYKEGNYSLAMETFKPLIKREPNNSFAEYASFYYALSAYKDGYPSMAKSTFLQMKERFPKWSRIDEVNYWLGKIYFENDDAYLALNVLNGIKRKDLEKEVDGLKYHFLATKYDVFELKAFYKDHVSDKMVGEVLAGKIAAQPIEEQDKKLLNELIDKFDLEKSDFMLAPVEKTVMKDVYKVAVLMPFMMDDLNANDRRRPNQFVVDLYQGLRMAVDSMNRDKKFIELFAYDTRRDSITTINILKNEELKDMDLIVGPLYPQPTRVVSRFALEYKINMFNPLSSSVETVGNNPYVFLFNPSVLTVGQTAADYAYDYFSDKPGLVLYGDTPNDRMMAQAYADRFLENGGKLVAIHNIEKDNSMEVLDILLSSDQKVKQAASQENRNAFSIPADSLGHIFVASENSLIYSKVISAVETRGDKVPIVGSAEWLNEGVIKYDVFRRLNARFYAPNYFSPKTDMYKSFRSAYLKQHREVPSKYALAGYEMGVFLSRSLKQNGKYPQVSWNKEGFMPGSILTGFDYSGTQDNQVVPFLEFSENGLDLIVRDNKKE